MGGWNNAQQHTSAYVFAGDWKTLGCAVLLTLIPALIGIGLWIYILKKK